MTPHLSDAEQLRVGLESIAAALRQCADSGAAIAEMLGTRVAPAIDAIADEINRTHTNKDDL